VGDPGFLQDVHHGGGEGGDVDPTKRRLGIPGAESVREADHIRVRAVVEEARAREEQQGEQGQCDRAHPTHATPSMI
jgi:hypothetical protein